MIPQNGQSIRQQHQSQQQQAVQAFMPSNLQNAEFDPQNYLAGLDPTAAAKQMAALNEANRMRSANPRAAVQSSVGSGSGPFIGRPPTVTQPVNSTSAIDHDPSVMVHNKQPFPLPNQPSFSQHVNSATNAPPNVDPFIAQSNLAARQQANASNTSSLALKQRNFLSGLANVMMRRGTPLPPALTGISCNYDPNMWKSLELPPGVVGAFRLAGKDVDLMKLWGHVFQSGGGVKFNVENKWHQLLPIFELPEQMRDSQGNDVPVAAVLGKYYMVLLHPFEDAYKQNLQSQHIKALAAAGRHPPPVVAQQTRQPQPQVTFASPASQARVGGGAGVMGLTGVSHLGALHAASPSSHTPQFPPPQQALPSTPTSTTIPQLGPDTPQTAASSTMEFLSAMSAPQVEKNMFDQDTLSLKRRHDGEEEDAKRSRMRSEQSDGTTTVPSSSDITSLPPPGSSIAASPLNTAAGTPRPRTQLTRRKIEYIPFAREVDTHGGRDLHFIEEEMNRVTQRRPLCDINEWGMVDIEALTMSIRSRLPTELSYSLTTFTLLSTMRAQAPGSGFPIGQCPDLLEELLNLLEESAFTDEDVSEWPVDPDLRTTTHREMVSMVQEEGNQIFASLQRHQGSKDPNLGPLQRPGRIILTALNVIRNLAVIPDNVPYLAKQERILDLLLRLCDVIQDSDGTPRATSDVLSLADLIAVRRDVLYILTSLAPMIHLPTKPSPSASRIVMRLFELIASYLVDPVEAISPYSCAQLAGISLNGSIKPPILPDVALELFTRLSVPDANRQVISRSLPSNWIWSFFEALVHRLPVAEADFQLVTREVWLCYLEKVVMSLYSLAFLAPPALKARVKADRTLGFTKVMLRMIQRFLMNAIPDTRSIFIVSVRRAIETMKIVDDGEDSFDTSKATVPTISFGMGYGEVGESGPEKGTGLLGGHRGLAWDLLMLREVDLDPVMFSELESLARIEIQ